MNWEFISVGAAVHRYHSKFTMAPQSVAEHSFRMALLALALWPDCPKEFLCAVLAHDMAEGRYGDVPSPTKRDVPGLKEALHAAESNYLSVNGCGWGAYLPTEWARRLHALDSLEGYLYCHEEIERGNKSLIVTQQRYAAYIGALGLPREDWEVIMAHTPVPHPGPLWEVYDESAVN